MSGEKMRDSEGLQKSDTVAHLPRRGSTIRRCFAAVIIEAVVVWLFTSWRKL